jgi:DNA-binding CsgD family transcriptional regulator/N-acetylneuraminic acid mutarotase
MSVEPSQISEREREILRLVAMGATNQQIAHQLNISINTVKVHLRNIFGKIGAASRTEATVYAIQQGLVALDRPPDAPSDATAPVATWFEGEPIAVAPMPDPPIVAPAEQAEPSLADVAEHMKPAPTVAPRRTLILVSIVIAVLIVALGLLTYTQIWRQTPSIDATTTPVELPQADRWKPRAPLSQPRSDFGVVAYDGKLYVAGGAASGPSAVIERYDPASNLWASLGEKPTPASQVQAAIVRGLIYVPGGEGADGKPLAVVEAYDPRNQRWETLPPLPEPRSRYALASVEGRLYLFGGWDGSSYRAEVFVYDPDAKHWSTAASMRTPRRGAGAAVVEGRIYVIGGENESGGLRINERYDPNGGQAGQWESVTPLQFAVSAPAVTDVAGNIWVFDAQKRTALQYNPSADAWKSIAIPDTIAVSSRAIAFNNTTIFLFGAPGSGTPGAVSQYQAIYSLFLPNTEANP